MKEYKTGFTLIEIMVVVSVISLLTSLGTYAVLQAVNNARIKTAESEMEMISTAILQLAWDTGYWPNGHLRNAGGQRVLDLSSHVAGLMYANTNGTFGADWKGPYYEGNIEDPWGDNYIFDPNYKGQYPAVASENKDVTAVRLD